MSDLHARERLWFAWYPVRLGFYPWRWTWLRVVRRIDWHVAETGRLYATWYEECAR